MVLNFLLIILVFVVEAGGLVVMQCEKVRLFWVFWAPSVLFHVVREVSRHCSWIYDTMTRCVGNRCRKATQLAGSDQLLPDTFSRLAFSLESMSTMFHESAILELEVGAVISSCRAGNGKRPENRGLSRRLCFVYYILPYWLDTRLRRL